MQNDIRKRAFQTDLQQNNEILEKLKNIHVHTLEYKCVGENFKFILGRCYYFDTSPKIFSVAKAHCSAIFNKFGRFGKLFEPIDINTFNKVKETAATFTTEYTWIGFVQRDATGLKRISDGLPATNVWGSALTSYSYNSFPNHPYFIFKPNSNYWDVECECSSDSNPSICEVI